MVPPMRGLLDTIAVYSCIFCLGIEDSSSIPGQMQRVTVYLQTALDGR